MEIWRKSVSIRLLVSPWSYLSRKLFAYPPPPPRSLYCLYFYWPGVARGGWPGVANYTLVNFSRPGFSMNKLTSWWIMVSIFIHIFDIIAHSKLIIYSLIPFTSDLHSAVNLVNWLTPTALLTLSKCRAIGLTQSILADHLVFDILWSEPRFSLSISHRCGLELK